MLPTSDIHFPWRALKLSKLVCIVTLQTTLAAASFNRVAGHKKVKVGELR
jgi:hypothetical protein